VDVPGPDGIANNADNRVDRYDFIDQAYSAEGMPYGFPATRFISPYKVYNYFAANPMQFTLNEVGAITGEANNSTLMRKRSPRLPSRGYQSADTDCGWSQGSVSKRTDDEGHGA